MVKCLKRFRFEAFWVLNKSSLGAVKAGWQHWSSGYSMFQAVNKIKHTHFSLNDWQRVNYGVQGREIEVLRGRLQVLLSLPLCEANQVE